MLYFACIIVVVVVSEFDFGSFWSQCHCVPFKNKTKVTMNETSQQLSNRRYRILSLLQCIVVLVGDKKKENSIEKNDYVVNLTNQLLRAPIDQNVFVFSFNTIPSIEQVWRSFI